MGVDSLKNGGAVAAKRNNYFDFIRGIAIMMVVGIHTGPVYSFNNASEFCYLCIRLVLNCAVPVFFAMSGFFLCSKRFNSGRDVMAFYKRQILKVYIPVLFCSIPFLALNFHYNGLANVVPALVNYFICGYSIYYFIAVIIQFYLLLPAILYLRNKGVGLFYPSAVISFVAVAVLNYYVWGAFPSATLIEHSGNFLLWIVFFVLGIELRNRDRNYSVGLLVVLAIVSFVLQVFETRYLMDIIGDSATSIKPSSFLFSIFVILIMFSKRIEVRYRERNWLVRGIRYLGNISFGIYLYHTLFVIATFKVTGQGIPSGVLWLVVIVGVSVVLTVARRVLPKRVHAYLGL